MLINGQPIANEYWQASHIDWYSFSMFTDILAGSVEHGLAVAMETLLDADEILANLITAEEASLKKGRKPFAHCYGNSMISVFFGLNTPWALVEVNGKGCAALQYQRLLKEVIHSTADRATRIDIAHDILAGHVCRVDEFVSGGFSSRYKTTSRIESSTGTSFYIGSRQSERMCRIYQYSEPHPRSNTLRVEFELKGKRAKELARMIYNTEVNAVASALGDLYEFRSHMWNPASGPQVEFAKITGKQRQNGTISWFHKQVVPAIKRLAAEGTIEDLEEFLREAFR